VNSAIKVFRQFLAHEGACLFAGKHWCRPVKGLSESAALAEAMGKPQNRVRPTATECTDCHELVSPVADGKQIILLWLISRPGTRCFPLHHADCLWWRHRKEVCASTVQANIANADTRRTETTYLADRRQVSDINSFLPYA